MTEPDAFDIPLVLASGSASRRAMLTDAGMDFVIDPADIDEGSIKAAMLDGGASAADIALALARAKTLAVAERRAAEGATFRGVVGSDSVVACGARLFDKPTSRDDAAAHLATFSGQTMTLCSAVALATPTQDGGGAHVVWDHVDTALLHVRDLSPAFIESYLDTEWPAIAGCVGCFRIEGRGVQLFDAIDGSHFTILGMPLLPVLRALRQHGMIAA